jgi:hypothetical protein
MPQLRQRSKRVPKLRCGAAWWGANLTHPASTWKHALGFSGRAGMQWQWQRWSAATTSGGKRGCLREQMELPLPPLRIPFWLRVPC